MFKFTVAFLLVICSVGVALQLQRHSVSKTDLFRQFRPYDPIRDTVSFFSNTFIDALSPFEVGQIYPDPLYLPTMKKSQRLSTLRRYHKLHKWYHDDVASEFERHFLLCSPPAIVASVGAGPSSFYSSPTDFDTDPTGFVAKGVIQAFSPLRSGEIKEKTMPPFHKQTNLSDLKSKLRRDPDYFH